MEPATTRLRSDLTAFGIKVDNRSAAKEASAMNLLPFHRFGMPGRSGRTPSWFRRCSTLAARALGSLWAFAVGAAFILAWALSGRWFHYSDTWQLIINTATSVVTFLAVFLIQNTQNREASAMHLKLDELIRAVEGTRKGLVHLEDLDDDQLEWLEAQFRRVREHAAREHEREPINRDPRGAPVG
jgi:low affinity Fe/Cu permease